MKNGIRALGFLIFGIELLVAAIYGLTLIPWYRLSFLIQEVSLKIILLILWNVAGALCLWLTRNDK